MSITSEGSGWKNQNAFPDDPDLKKAGMWQVARQLPRGLVTNQGVKKQEQNILIFRKVFLLKGF